MPAPTVTSVTPSSGLTGGGSLVTIAGTNFEIDVATPVVVTFGTLPATDVRVLTATSLTCLPPRGPIADASSTLVVSVSVQNTGGPNVGTGTLVTAYTYRRPDLTVETHLAAAVRALLQLLKQQVIANVALTTHTDYDEATSDLLNRVALAKLPVVVLIGPRLREHRIVNYNDPVRIFTPAGSTPTLVEAFDQVRAVTLEFEVLLMSEHKIELLNLIHHATAFTQRNEYVDVPIDPLNPAAGTVRYPLLVEEEFAASDPLSRSNVREARGSLALEGVLMSNGDKIVSEPTVASSVLTTELFTP
jgi:hypothetical protein